ncbi:MAG: porin family protein [Cyclobacteriaceae bacterium]
MKYTNKVVAFIGVVLFLSASWDGYGQSGIRVGITGGINANQIKTSTNVSNLLWKYNAGISGTKKFSGNFSLTSELSYSRQGRRLNLSSTRKYVTNFDYLALPVLLRFSPVGKELFIQAGGKFGLLVNSKETYIYNNNNSPNNLQHLRQWDAGALAGLGYPLGSHIVVDVRYYHGLVPLIKDHWILGSDSTPIFYGADRWVHRVWSMNLTYYL